MPISPLPLGAPELSSPLSTLSITAAARVSAMVQSKLRHLSTDGKSDALFGAVLRPLLLRRASSRDMLLLVAEHADSGRRWRMLPDRPTPRLPEGGRPPAC